MYVRCLKPLELFKRFDILTLKRQKMSFCKLRGDAFWTDITLMTETNIFQGLPESPNAHKNHKYVLTSH